jgi:Flp pilus assembly pilin Flp
MIPLPAKLSSALSSLIWREEGQALVEYMLLLALISVAVIGVLTVLGQDASSLFSRINAEFN